jgi:protein-S-isoprenylcysteine O-methyltransferase Ste14
MNPTLLDYVCWSVLALVWVSSAMYNLLEGPMIARTRTKWFVWLALGLAVVLVVLSFVTRAFWPTLTSRPAWLAALGAILLGASTLFSLWARAALGRMWSSAPLVKQGHDLRTSGPYAITRHPIYTGILGMLLGTTLEHGFGRLLPYFVLFLGVLELKIRTEERASPGEMVGALESGGLP